jgi:hypothetical protein
MNENNPYPASTRSFYYGINEVPYAMLNGGTGPGMQYDFNGPGGTPDQEVLNHASLEIPDFDVNLDVDWKENNLEAFTSVTCRVDTFTSNIQLYVAVIETEINAYQGTNQSSRFHNVVLDMLPSPAGKLLGNAWSRWMTESRSYSWDYASYIEDIEELAVVAFIQNRDNGHILQAAARYLTPQVGTGPLLQDGGHLQLYPNPATDLVHVYLGDIHPARGGLKLTDLTGKMVLSRDIRPGETRHTLEVSELAGGMYLLWWEERGEIKARTKLILSR